MTKAFAYLRTSSAANIGQDKDSASRQRAAIQAYATANDIDIVDEFNDEAVSGANSHVYDRPGFADMLNAINANGVRLILVENCSRFARDVLIAETGYRYLKDAGIELVACDSPQAFLDDGPTSILIRQILSAVSQFEKAMVVSKLRSGRLKARRLRGRCEGRKPPSVTMPTVVALAVSLRAEGMSLQQIADALQLQGHLTQRGTPYTRSQVARFLAPQANLD